MMFRMGALAVVLLALGGCRRAEGTPPSDVREVAIDEIQAVATEARFLSVRDVIQVDGALWVLNGAPPFITRVSLEEGDFLEFGAEGGGPGELRSPWGMQATPGGPAGGIRVWDLGLGRVSTFDAGGGFHASDRLSPDGIVRARGDIREVSYADPFRIRAGAEGVLLARFPGRVNRTGDFTTGSLWRAGPALDPEREVAGFRDHVAQGAEALKEWAAVPFWDACGDRVVLWSPESERVVWLDGRGGSLGTVPVEVRPGRVSPEDIERYLRKMSRLELGPGHEEAGIDYAVVARSMQSQFAEERPFATDLRCQEPGIAWIRLFDTALDPLGRSQSWLRVPEEGLHQRLVFPAGFTPVLFTPQRIYGLLEVPAGYHRLAWWSEGNER